MKRFKCGCGYEDTSIMFDYSYHNNNGCGNEYIETVQVEKVYIIFTRHELTDAQWREIKDDASQFDGGINDCEVIHLKELASRNIRDLDEAEQVYNELKQVLKRKLKLSPHVEVYGTIPAPVRFLMWEDSNVRKGEMVIVNESFNINRSKEGEKPTFEHACWLPTGTIWV